MRVLHLSHHDGCHGDLEYVHHRLGMDIERIHYPFGYNICQNRADEIWNELADRINTYDVVLVSDTAPLSRIILQHMDSFRGHLIIWVCNRFDYKDNITNDCGFPDQEYYQLFKHALTSSRVTVIPYTDFERVHANRVKLSIRNVTIKPLGLTIREDAPSIIPECIDKPRSYFVPPYHNDRLFSLHNRLCDMGFENYDDRYAGASDLKGFAGIVHIPYAWSNFALFENWQNRVVYAIPSLRFMRNLSREQGFFWSPPFEYGLLSISEWYCSKNAGNFVYFDSWTDLKRILDNWNIHKHRAQSVLSAFCGGHTITTLKEWENVYRGISKI
jgi:hypothetical protein